MQTFRPHSFKKDALIIKHKEIQRLNSIGRVNCSADGALQNSGHRINDISLSSGNDNNLLLIWMGEDTAKGCESSLKVTYPRATVFR